VGIHFRAATVRFLAYFLPTHGNREASVLGKLPYSAAFNKTSTTAGHRTIYMCMKLSQNIGLCTPSRQLKSDFLHIKPAASFASDLNPHVITGKC
jgi:hypothetical protein